MIDNPRSLSTNGILSKVTVNLFDVLRSGERPKMPEIRQGVGFNNVYVADLSAVPLPRVSTQMTAYPIGFHVAKMLSSGKRVFEK